MYDAINTRNKLMVDKLKEQVARGFIENDWAETFICDIHAKVHKGQSLSVKQQGILDDMFERY